MVDNKRTVIMVHPVSASSTRMQMFVCLQCSFKTLDSEEFLKHINMHTLRLSVFGGKVEEGKGIQNRTVARDVQSDKQVTFSCAALESPRETNQNEDVRIKQETDDYDEYGSCSLKMRDISKNVVLDQGRRPDQSLFTNNDVEIEIDVCKDEVFDSGYPESGHDSVVSGLPQWDKPMRTRRLMDSSIIKGSHVKSYQCNQSFEAPSRLQGHVGHHLQGEPRLPSSYNYDWSKSVRRPQREASVYTVMYWCILCDATIESHRFHKHFQMHRQDLDLKCHLCPFSVANSVQFHRHMMRHRLSKVKERNLAMRCGEGGPRQVKRRMQDNRLLCNYCGFATRYITGFKLHLQKHRGEKPLHCAHCEYKTANSTHLTQHLRVHTGERPFSCSDCGSAFTSSSALQRHLSTHTGERPHVCTACGFRFRNSSNLTRHLRCHTGERPYPCPDCNFQSARAGGLQRHRNRHCKGRCGAKRLKKSTQLPKCKPCPAEERTRCLAGKTSVDIQPRVVIRRSDIIDRATETARKVQCGEADEGDIPTTISNIAMSGFRTNIPSNVYKHKKTGRFTKRNHHLSSGNSKNNDTSAEVNVHTHSGRFTKRSQRGDSKYSDRSIKVNTYNSSGRFRKSNQVHIYNNEYNSDNSDESRKSLDFVTCERKNNNDRPSCSTSGKTADRASVISSDKLAKLPELVICIERCDSTKLSSEDRNHKTQ